MVQACLYFLICIGATTLGAISGIGGGIIIRPVMDAVSAFSVSTVSFLSGCTVLAMSVSSMLRRDRTVQVESRRGTALAVGGAVGGVAGKLIFDVVKLRFGNDILIGAAQNLLLIILTLGTLIYVCNKDRIRTLNLQNLALCAGIGLMLGGVGAFLGIGGGPINLVVLFYFFSMDTKTAALNSLYIILFSQIASVLTTFGLKAIPPFQWPVLLLMIAGGVAGGLLGRSLSVRMSARQVDRLFCCLLLVIAAICVFNFYQYTTALV